MAEEKILIVDDDENIVILLKLHLEIEGYQLSFAYNGEMALEKLFSDKPDLILLDIMMPKMDGWQVCEKIKDINEFSDIPIIMLTAKSRKEDIKKGWELGVDDYIIKPFSPERLMEVVRKVLFSRSFEKEVSIIQSREIYFQSAKVALVGTGNIGISILKYLIGDSRIKIMAIADTDPASPMILLAKKLNIFSTTNLDDLLKIEGLELIFLFSDKQEVLDFIETRNPRKIGVIRENTANFIWYLIEQRTDLEEKQRSLVRELNKRVNEVEMLYEGSKVMASAIDMDSILKSTIDIMAKAMRVDSGLMLLLDEETDEWIASASYNFPMDLLKGKEPLNHGQGIARLALKKNQPIVIEDVSHERHNVILSDIPGIVTSIVLPLFIKDKAFGVVYLNHNFQKKYKEDDINFISTLANQASIYLENSRLYEAVKQKHQAVERLLAKLLNSSDGLGSKSLEELKQTLGKSVSETVSELERCHDVLYSELNILKDQVDIMKKISEESLERIRNIADLPLAETDKDFMSLLESYLKHFETDTGIITELIFSGIKRKLAESIEITIYRIIQEALKNVKEHSRASTVRVRVKVLSDQFNVAIEDDGIGFDQTHVMASMSQARYKGINSIKEKISFLGGTFKIRSNPGRGTSVLLRIPIPGD